MIQNREKMEELMKPNNFMKHDLWEARTGITIVGFLISVLLVWMGWQLYDWKTTTFHSERGVVISKNIASTKYSAYTNVTVKIGVETLRFSLNPGLLAEEIKPGDSVDINYSQSRSGSTNVLKIAKTNVKERREIGERR